MAAIVFPATREDLIKVLKVKYSKDCIPAAAEAMEPLSGKAQQLWDSDELSTRVRLDSVSAAKTATIEVLRSNGTQFAEAWEQLTNMLSSLSELATSNCRRGRSRSISCEIFCHGRSKGKDPKGAKAAQLEVHQLFAFALMEAR